MRSMPLSALLGRSERAPTVRAHAPLIFFQASPPEKYSSGYVPGQLEGFSNNILMDAARQHRLNLFQTGVHSYNPTRPLDCVKPGRRLLDVAAL
jgi:hypothetical protein